MRMHNVSQYTYNAEKKHLVFLAKNGRPLLSVAGNLGQKIFERINQNRQKMKMNAEALERKIGSLNEWIMHNEGHRDYNERVQNRNYYVNKLIELNESNLKTIDA